MIHVLPVISLCDVYLYKGRLNKVKQTLCYFLFINQHHLYEE